jgi:glutaconate CoA-transferase subunit B
LPGSGGAADIATMAKRCIIIINHEKRRFRKRVQFVTSPGFGSGRNWRAHNNLPGGGPSTVITTLGIFAFERASREMVLSSRHPGIAIADIQRETGWRMKLAETVSVTRPPSREELAAIRKYDPQKIWTS